LIGDIYLPEIVHVFWMKVANIWTQINIHESINLLVGNLQLLAMFFMCELQTVKRNSNYFEKFDQSAVDFMPSWIAQIGAQRLTMLKLISCYTWVHYNGATL